MATASATKKPIAKKPTAKKTNASSTKTTSTANKPSTARTTAKKSAPAKKAATTTRKPPVDTRERGPHGFAVGTDSAIIAESLIEGGASRDECNDRAVSQIEKTSGLTTRGGQPKYIPSMSATIIKHLVNSGLYEIESSFRLVPVKGGASASVKKAPVAKKAPAKTTAKKTPARRKTTATK